MRNYYFEVKFQAETSKEMCQISQQLVTGNKKFIPMYTPEVMVVWSPVFLSQLMAKIWRTKVVPFSTTHFL